MGMEDEGLFALVPQCAPTASSIYVRTSMEIQPTGTKVGSEDKERSSK
jgi:hypothetical protein